jgi:malonate transporter and related proteins
MLIVATIVLVSWCLAVSLLAKLFFGHTRQEAGIADLNGRAPTVGFLGTAVLAPLFGVGATVCCSVGHAQHVTDHSGRPSFALQDHNR